jgi:hypothetical protein
MFWLYMSCAAQLPVLGLAGWVQSEGPYLGELTPSSVCKGERIPFRVKETG